MTSVLVSVDRYQVITGDTDSATAQVETAIGDAADLLADELGWPGVILDDYTETLPLAQDPWTGVLIAFPTVRPVHSEANGLTVRDDVVYGATPVSSPSFYGLASPPVATTLTYSAGWAADGTGRAKTPAGVERDVAWVAHMLLHPTDRLQVPAGASSVQLGDARVSFAAPVAPGQAGIVWSKATRAWRRRSP